MKAKAPFRHLPKSFLLGPALNHDAIDGAHGPRAISAMMAMDKDRSVRWLCNKLHELDHILHFWVPGLHGNVFLLQLGGPDGLAVRMKGTQVDHGLDTQFIERLPVGGRGLVTAIKGVGDPEQIGNPCGLDRNCS